MQAIRDSDCYTEDIEQAQAVYVYDYCYYIWWLATLHSRGGASMTTSPGDYLVKASLPAAAASKDHCRWWLDLLSHLLL